MWTDFNNPFTFAFCNELWKKLLYNPPPTCNLSSSVAALPCEIWILNCTTVQDIHAIQVCKVVYFSVNIYRNDMIAITRLCRLIYNITVTCSKYLPSLIVHCWAKHLTNAVAICCADVMSWRQRHSEKRHLS